MTQTAEIRRLLPLLIGDLDVKTMLDIPCGDWHWMKDVPLLTDYIGADIVPELVEQNQQLYGNETYRFLNLDLIRDDLPKVDLVLSRDVLVNLLLMMFSQRCVILKNHIVFVDRHVYRPCF